MGLENYVCDELHWAVRETLRASGCGRAHADGVVHGGDAVRDVLRARRRRSRLCATCVAADDADRRPRLSHMRAGSRQDFDVRAGRRAWRVIPGQAIDFANKLLKPVTNFCDDIPAARARGSSTEPPARESYQPMAKWVADNPPFPGRAWAEWIRWMYQDDALVGGRIAPARPPRRSAARSTRTCWSSPPAPTTSLRARARCRSSTSSASEDVTHFDRPGGHIGLMAGSAANRRDLARPRRLAGRALGPLSTHTRREP